MEKCSARFGSARVDFQKARMEKILAKFLRIFTFDFRKNCTSGAEPSLIRAEPRLGGNTTNYVQGV